MNIRDKFLEIRPVTQDNLDAVLEVYQHCEDFLALGPVATASMEMVLKDIEISKNEGGTFCGIYTADGKMNATVPDQHRKPTQKPTIRWVFQLFEGLDILLVRRKDQIVLSQLLNLRPAQQQVITFLSPQFQKSYLFGS